MASAKYRFFISLLKHIEDIKETEKTKISMVYHTGNSTHCILRVCKGRDLSELCKVLCETRHPNLAVVYDYVYEDGDTYILEEHINGKTVKDIMDEDGLISELQTAKIISAVCNALEILHQKTPPIVHNDINPSNIMICDDGTVKLFDFDISRLYQKGKNKNTILFGTEEYASPEHFGYGQSEPRTDIYCLGVTMHKMLTDSSLTSEHKITYNGKLKNIITKCLEVDPNRRYTSVSELKKKLESFISRKKRIARVIICVLCILAVALCGFFVYSAIDYSINPSKADLNSTTETTSHDTASIQSSSDVALSEEYTKDLSENQGGIIKESSVTSESLLNNTRETATTVSVEENIVGNCRIDTPAWYRFKTSDKNSIYRINLYPINAPTNVLFNYLNASVYDSVGIKLYEFEVRSDDEYAFLDFHTESNTEYFIKITLGGRFDSGSYEMSISEMVCDAGTDKNTAAKLELNKQYTAKLDSTLSDWYMFHVPHDGDYTYTIHNIDVGCDIYFSEEQPRSAGEGMYISNEDNFSGTINNVKRDESVYFEIYPSDKNPKANGNYIIVIKEKEQ